MEERYHISGIEGGADADDADDAADVHLRPS